MPAEPEPLKIIVPEGHLSDVAASLLGLIAKAAAGDRHADKTLRFVERYGSKP